MIHNCDRPNGVKISAPSLYLQVFKKLAGPEAVNPVVDAVVWIFEAKPATDESPVGYLAP